MLAIAWVYLVGICVGSILFGIGAASDNKLVRFLATALGTLLVVVSSLSTVVELAS
jgi:hypothetical protein